MIDTLSPSELDILRLISLGYSRQGIAEIRLCEISTVTTTTHTIYRKLGVTRTPERINSRVTAARMYIARYGL
jgi:DNA-binding NarL/FixJ family response regulator